MGTGKPVGKHHRESRVPQSAQQKVATHSKRVRCVELATQGLSYSEIARTVGFSGRGAAYKAIAAALRAQQAPAVDELRALEIERLDALQRSCWDSAIAGDISAVDRVLKVIAARVRLLGLDQNTDKAVSGGGRLLSMSWQPDPVNGAPIEEAGRALRYETDSSSVSQVGGAIVSTGGSLDGGGFAM